MKAIIIAGGPGTRLQPLTYAVPKPIIPLVNKPILVHQIELLKKHGITEIVLNLHYKSDSIQKLLGDGKKFGVKLFYSFEEKPLDTAGAVKNAQEFFDSDPMIVCNGDILTNLDLTALMDFHRSKRSELTFTLTRVDDPSAFGLIVTDANGKVKNFLEKPSKKEAIVDTINAGTYVINTDLFEYIPKGVQHSFERQFFPKMLNIGKNIYGFDSDSYWMDIGNPQKYFEAHQDILLNKIKVNIDGQPIGGNFIGERFEQDPSVKLSNPIAIGNDVTIDAGVQIYGPSVLGNKVRVGAKSKLTQVIVHENVTIGKNCIISKSILGKNSIIEDDCILSPGIIYGADTVIKQKTHAFA